MRNDGFIQGFTGNKDYSQSLIGFNNQFTGSRFFRYIIQQEYVASSPYYLIMAEDTRTGQNIDKNQYSRQANPDWQCGRASMDYVYIRYRNIVFCGRYHRSGVTGNYPVLNALFVPYWNGTA